MSAAPIVLHLMCGLALPLKPHRICRVNLSPTKAVGLGCRKHTHTRIHTRKTRAPSKHVAGDLKEIHNRRNGQGAGILQDTLFPTAKKVRVNDNRHAVALKEDAKLMHSISFLAFCWTSKYLKPGFKALPSCLNKLWVL